MRVLISGASGFIGAPLSLFLNELGFSVYHLTWAPAVEPHQISWPLSSRADLENFDAVIQLAGEPLTFSRWGSAKRRRIFESRVTFTKELTSLLANQSIPPKIFISASAVGYYGDRGEESLNEACPPGFGFLSELCQKWEAASEPLSKLSTRKVQTRFGIVLGPNGGALKRLIPLYRWGLGATFGSGSQWFSWIALKDLVHAIVHILHTPSLEGAVNCVSPHPIRQKEFSHLLAHLLHRPTCWKIPASIAKTILGPASEMLLSSAKVVPQKLLDSGFQFEFPHLASFLPTLLTY